MEGAAPAASPPRRGAHAARAQALFGAEFVPLDMDKTLTENGVLDESEEFAALDIHEDEFIPVLHLYFNDDLTVA